jgi:hypothetical protein
MKKNKFSAGLSGRFRGAILPQTDQSPIFGVILPKVWNRHFRGSSLVGLDGETIAVLEVGIFRFQICTPLYPAARLLMHKLV